MILNQKDSLKKKCNFTKKEKSLENSEVSAVYNTPSKSRFFMLFTLV